MSIVIVGGNERMVCQYHNICKNYGCKAKVFAKEKGAMKKNLGCPDLMILFTNTVLQEAKKNNIPIARIHTSSAAALHTVLNEYTGKESVVC